MPQIFHRSFNVISRVTIFGFLIIIALLCWMAYVWQRSSYATNVGIVRDQPAPFSHQHHVEGLGIDCRYCHNSADKSSFAGMPATKVCMNCHQQIWVGSSMLEPVRQSYSSGVPIAWQRVHRLADFAYFNHSVHVNKGVGCSTCHGNVQQMPLMYQHGSLLMEWCLECHRGPEKFVRPRSEVYNMEWKPEDVRAPMYGRRLGDWDMEKSTEENRRALVDKYGIRKLTNCTTCHR
jgi:hypothetical protein